MPADCSAPTDIEDEEYDGRTQCGERIEVTATDAGFPIDAESWCRTTGNRLISISSKAGIYNVVIEKGEPQRDGVEGARPSGDGKTFILFSDDLDKALATFVLANGAAATGRGSVYSSRSGDSMP